MDLHLNIVMKRLFSVVIILILLTTVQNAEAVRQQRLLQKIDELEIETRKENLYRREEINDLRRIFDRMEEQLNNSLSILDQRVSELPHTKTHSTVMEPKIVDKQLENSKIEEVLNAFKYLKQGFYEEKKMTSRLRRHVTQLQSQLDNQRNVSEGFSDGIATILEMMTNAKTERKAAFDVLNVIKNDVTNVQETGMILKSEMNITKQETMRIEEILHSDIKGSLDVLKINSNQINEVFNETMSVCSKGPELNDDLKKLRNQLVYNCETDKPTSCKEILKAGCHESDVYRLYLETGKVKVYCDQQTDGGGWMVFQRRQDGSVDFFRTWEEYKEGFGSVTGEFWLGNDKLHSLLSNTKQNELRVDLGDFEGNKAYAKYSNFTVGPESDGYRLIVGGYSGDAGDSLRIRHNDQTFVTYDRDRGSCSRLFKGGWWYSGCHHANLNGLYNSTSDTGIIWKDWKGFTYSLKYVEMKFRKSD